MDTPLKELGHRLAARRGEAGIGLSDLATATHVSVARLERFEAGEGGLAAGALARIARVLGVPEASFLHTCAPERPATREMGFLLKEVGHAALLSPDDRSLLTRQLDRARRFTEIGELLAVEPLTAKIQPRKAKRSKAYLAGYDLARTVRGLLGIGNGPLRELRRLVEDRFDILVVDHSFTARRVQAACCRSGASRLVALSQALDFETSQRTILAHELCHHLVDLGDEGILADREETNEGFTFDRSPEEQRARAFAVMFLAPREAIREILDEPRHQISKDAAAEIVTNLRLRFGIGFQAMAWHLFHLYYFSFHEDDVIKLASYGDELDPTGFETDVGRDGLHRRVQNALKKDLITGERARTLLGEYTPAMA